jgi:hypothetical protein
MNLGVKTDTNRAIQSRLFDEINSGNIATFNDLEKSKLMVTQGQYQELENALSLNLAENVRDTINIEALQTKVRASNGDILTLNEALDSIAKADIKIDEKEAMSVILETTFALQNTNPKLSKPYKAYTAELMRLERWLGLRGGEIASSLQVDAGMTEEELKTAVENLKSIYEPEKQDALKKLFNTFSIGGSEPQRASVGPVVISTGRSAKTGKVYNKMSDGTTVEVK